MKLELKHWSAYLPYELKMITGRYYNEETKKHENIISEMCGVSNTHVEYRLKGGTSSFYLGNEKVQPKPILHPLSDITKIIEVNGEKIKVCDLLISVSGGFFGMLSPDEKTIQNRINIGQLFNSDMDTLLKYNFDIFGLIENGLAVDFNSL